MIRYVNSLIILYGLVKLRKLTNIELMGIALSEARKALIYNDVPIGAVISLNGIIISKAHNQVERFSNSLYHAEYIVIQKAIKKIEHKHLKNCDIYVTLEPCSMCAGAIVLSRLKNVYYGASDSKAGACGSILNIIENKNFNHQAKVYSGLL